MNSATCMHLVQVGAGMLLHYMSTLLEVGARLSGIRRRMDGGGGLLRGLCELYPGWGTLALVVSSGEMCS